MFILDSCGILCLEFGILGVSSYNSGVPCDHFQLLSPVKLRVC